MFRLQLVPRRIPNSMRVLRVYAFAVSWLLILSSAADAFDVVQITDNGTDDWYADICGSNVVWWGCRLIQMIRTGSLPQAGIVLQNSGRLTLELRSPR